MPSRGWVAQTLTVMEGITAYSILKELGNDALSTFTNIAELTLDSHRITNYFPQDFKTVTNVAIKIRGRRRHPESNAIIANRIGIYLGHKQQGLAN